jgi:FAD dependent oxidoreductase
MSMAEIALSLDADVLVCGGGIAGTMAAVAAARHGADVLLVERYGFLGGNATAGAVSQFNSWQTAGGRRIVAGLAAEVVERLTRMGGAGQHQVFTMSTGHKMDRVEYAPETLKIVLDEMVSEAGVRPLFHASLLDVAAGGRQIETVRVLTKSGVIMIRPRVLIDTSGDVDALKRAGARFLELDDGETLQPATMMFRFGPIDFARFEAITTEEMVKLAKTGFEQGHLARAALHCARDPFSRDAWFNISRLAVDATDVMALSRAEIEGRRQAWRAASYLKSSVPGCTEGQLVSFGTQVGVRETRRIEGDHVLTAEELLKSEPFDDAIAMGAYPIDIHPASGGGLDYRALGEDHAYQIPYRSLIPTGFDNALTAGRGVSATHAALAAIRVMTISMAVGQAAGTAAALAARRPEGTNDFRADVRSVPIETLHALLEKDGACLK